MSAPVGRRERKKAATRQALADTALTLFLEHGYDDVTIRDIADAVDVSTTTLLKYFPTKEALVFDEDTEQEAALVAAVRDRPEGRSIPQALCAHIKQVRIGTGDPDTRFAAFVRLVADTPALSQYAHRMWMRHQDALARAIAEAAGEQPQRLPVRRPRPLRPGNLGVRPSHRQRRVRRGHRVHSPRARLGRPIAEHFGQGLSALARLRLPSQQCPPGCGGGARRR